MRRFFTSPRHPVVGLLTVLALLPGGCAPASEEDRRPNLILIVADTLRADALSIHGGSTPTPNLDHLARSGIRFERAYSHVPVTGPSHGSMFTGLLPDEHGARINTHPLREEFETLAEKLRAQGYQTAAIVSLGVLRAKYGFAQGFDEFNEDFGENFHRPANEVSDAALDWLAKDRQEPFFLWVHYSDPHEPYSPPTETFPRIEAWLNSRYLETFTADGYRQGLEVELQSGDNTLVLSWPRGEPRPDQKLQFRQVRLWNEDVGMTARGQWLSPAGSPGSQVTRLDGSSALPVELTLTNHRDKPQTVRLTFLCHEEYTAESIRRLYAAEAAFLDLQIGRLLAELERQDLLASSVVLFTSDHGEGLGDHELLGHIHQVYDSLVRVPLFITAPGQLVADWAVKTPVRHIDLLPTVLDLLALEPRPELSGTSLVPMMTGAAPQVPLPILSATYRPLADYDQRSLLRYPFKYIVNLQTGQEELYDLSRDPGEVHNLIDEHPEKAAELADTLRLAEENRAVQSPDNAEPTELTQDEIDKLEALGYVN